ncbi:TPA: hypothetical protein L4U31_002853 [Pseudomonas aeruginosa]|nr:hypothetical protein [Pseudomonas aeruginosa]
MARKPTAKSTAGKDAAQPAATAPAEQLANQPAGSTQASVTAPADTSGASAAAGASSEQPTASEAPSSAAPAVDGAGGTTGQDAHPNTEAAAAVAAPTAQPAPAAPLEPVGGADLLARPEASALAATGADDGSDNDGEVEGLWVRAVPEQGFRRCGYSFTREGYGIALSALTDAQVQALESEPNLIVERGVFSGQVE